MYLITQTKQGISSIELGRRLGTTQTTAWKIKTKLAEVMRIDNDRTPLDGRVEIVEAGGLHARGDLGADAGVAVRLFQHDAAVGLAHRREDQLLVERSQRPRGRPAGSTASRKEEGAPGPPSARPLRRRTWRSRVSTSRRRSWSWVDGPAMPSRAWRVLRTAGWSGAEVASARSRGLRGPGLDVDRSGLAPSTDTTFGPYALHQNRRTDPRWSDA